MLTAAQIRRLRQLGWDQYVGQSTGIWVQIDGQRLTVIVGNRIIADYVCSTAAAGPGEKIDSLCTPTGWHEIYRCIGGELPEGAVLNGRTWTNDVWNPSQPGKADLILSRVLWLRGLEPGHNQGGDVDTQARYIYIHGTHDEQHLGTPMSHGCIRLSNRDVIDLFGRVEPGTRVLISADPEG